MCLAFCFLAFNHDSLMICRNYYYVTVFIKKKTILHKYVSRCRNNRTHGPLQSSNTLAQNTYEQKLVWSLASSFDFVGTMGLLTFERTVWVHVVEDAFVRLWSKFLLLFYWWLCSNLEVAWQVTQVCLLQWLISYSLMDNIV